MRCLNENIARRANKEDNCKGRFWEGRFKCQALLDEGALLTCMAYVDLNPIRAGMAQTPEESDFTSIQERIDHQADGQHVEIIEDTNSSDTGYETADNLDDNKENHVKELWLHPFNSAALNGPASIIPLTFEQYLELVDWTGRLWLKGKKISSLAFSAA